MLLCLLHHCLCKQNRLTLPPSLPLTQTCMPRCPLSLYGEMASSRALKGLNSGYSFTTSGQTKAPTEG